ncbi:MAG: aminotransferase DegT [Campylobacteraceae bacterium 4484_166]|nr:MAG: aminotransferase DegT [Campylobacteraceae bacterium 4484_166]
MKIDFINLQAQYQKYKIDIDKQIQEVLDSSAYIGGKVTKLEEKLNSFVGCKHSIACSSGTDALILSLMAVGLQPDDEVITTAFTFIATAEAIAFLKAKPVFVDIDGKTFNIDSSKIEEKITNKTKVILPVSLFGQISNMDEINNIAKKHQLIVIEDGAQSFGASYNNKISGNLCDIGTTSFFPAKPLGCYGDGGAIFTNDDKIAQKLRVLLNHGQTAKYIHSDIGINGRLDAIQAAVLIAKLDYYQDEIDKRDKIASRYTKELKTVKTPIVLNGLRSVWAQYSVLSDDREKLMKRCQNKGVPTAVYYPIPLHLQKVFSYLGYKDGDLPKTEKISKEIFSLPISAFLKDDEQSYIIEVLNNG